jgi:hypothetical protein
MSRPRNREHLRLVPLALLAASIIMPAVVAAPPAALAVAADPGTSTPPNGAQPSGEIDIPHRTALHKNGVTEEVTTWRWNIAAAHYQQLPEYSCPASAPYVMGAQFNKKVSLGVEKTYVHVANMRMEVSDGVGYKGIIVATFGRNDGVHKFMTGWRQGNFFDNSIFAPPFKGGTATLTVTCTSNMRPDAPSGAAWIQNTSSEHSFTRQVFPWHA